MYKIDNQIKKVWNFCEWKCNVPTYNVQYVLETSQKGKKPVKTPLPGLQYRIQYFKIYHMRRNYWIEILNIYKTYFLLYF